MTMTMLGRASTPSTSTLFTMAILALPLQGKYAINVYFDKLFELLSLCEVVDTRHKYQDDVNKMMTLLCRHMSSAHIKEAAFIFKRSHGRSTSEQVRKAITVDVVNQ